MIPSILPTFTPHWTDGLSNESYHADKMAVSASSLKRMQDSPQAFINAHTTFSEPTPDMEFGTAVHMALLEPELFAMTCIVQPEFKGTGSVAEKKKWMETVPPGALIMKQDKMDDIQSIVKSVMGHKDARNALKTGVKEMTGYFTDPETGIKCRIRPDLFSDAHMSLLDVKTTRDSCSLEQFSKTIYSYGYHFQMAFYAFGIQQITGKKVKFPLFIAIEKKAPFECAMFIANEDMMTRGAIEVRAALNKLKVCIDSGDFLSRQLHERRDEQSKIQEIGLPDWAKIKE